MGCFFDTLFLLRLASRVVMIVMKNIAVEYFLDLGNFKSRIVVGVDDTQVVVDKLDRIVWKTRNDMDSGFSVATVWDCIRPRGAKIDWYNLVWFSHNIPRHSIHLWLVIQRKLKTQDKLRQWDVSSNTNLNLLQCPLCERQPDSHDHLFFECIFSLQVPNPIYSLMASDSYACWMKWWLSSDPMARGSVYDFGYVLRVECQARAVLFFPSPRFFPLGFSWEGFLRRQSQMMSYYPSMQFWVGCGDSCSLKWFLPIGVIVSVVG
ncbi:reverse transcriptase domain, reverse transcriptase zinc-binding domain protein [Tanacetum coccineum]|uniref:Reverse transcriptase domain, reverse transcriptase zinc-binding domain protein n=1 Tax=Tanacetum coccineum TaxID=301880 RepID=A0ABQ4X9K8_9ASTR